MNLDITANAMQCIHNFYTIEGTLEKKKYFDGEP